MIRTESPEFFRLRGITGTPIQSGISSALVPLLRMVRDLNSEYCMSEVFSAVDHLYCRRPVHGTLAVLTIYLAKVSLSTSW